MASVDLYSSAWCDTVFENKNKEYGAYIVRQQSGLRHFMAILIVGTFLVSIFYGLQYFKSKKDTSKQSAYEELSFINVQDLNEKEKVEIVIPLTPQKVLSTIGFSVPKATNEDVETDILTQQELSESNLKIAAQTIAGNTTNEDEATDELVEVNNKIVERENKEILISVSEMPDFPGGVEELLKFISKNTKYPALALETETEGVVYVNFVVETDGSISNIKIGRSVGSGCDEEAIRVIKMMPTWNPGKQNGTPRRVSLSMPIRFAINK